MHNIIYHRYQGIYFKSMKDPSNYLIKGFWDLLGKPVQLPYAFCMADGLKPLQPLSDADSCCCLLFHLVNPTITLDSSQVMGLARGSSRRSSSRKYRHALDEGNRLRNAFFFIQNICSFGIGGISSWDALNFGFGCWLNQKAPDS